MQAWSCEGGLGWSTWEGVEAPEEAGEGGFDEGSKGTIPTGTMLQLLWFLGHIRWIFSFFSSSMSLQDKTTKPSQLWFSPLV